MQKTLALVSLLALTIAAVPGCASDDSPPPLASAEPPTFVKESVRVDQHFSDTAMVEDAKITLPADAANQASLGAIKVGSILAGNRGVGIGDELSESNPYGFLRRVTSITPSGSSVVLETVNVDIADWVASGRLDYINSDPLFDFSTTDGTSSQSLDVLGEPTPKTEKGRVDKEVPVDKELGEDKEEKKKRAKFPGKFTSKFSNAKLKLNGAFDGYFERKGTSADFRAKLSVDPKLTFFYEFGLKTQATKEVPYSWKSEVWKGKSVKFKVAAGPIPITIKLTPELQCGLSMSAAINTVTQVTLGAHAAIGAEGHASVGGDHTLKELNDKPSLSEPKFDVVSVEGKGSVTGNCHITARIQVLLFDTAGLVVHVGPYGEVTANACLRFSPQQKIDRVTSGFGLTQKQGIYLEASARIQIPEDVWFIGGDGKEWEILKGRDIPIGNEHYLYGAKGAGQFCKSSCTGQPDGYICIADLMTSELLTCSGGQSTASKTCPKGCSATSDTIMSCD
jgi:hypothetical protein